jgi:hypothetical protein
VTTATQSTTAKAPRQPNKLAGEGCHAFVQNGAIHLLQSGRVRPVSRWEAVETLLCLEGSPYPSSQERARQIRAALKETMQ